MNCRSELSVCLTILFLVSVSFIVKGQNKMSNGELIILLDQQYNHQRRINSFELPRLSGGNLNLQEYVKKNEMTLVIFNKLEYGSEDHLSKYNTEYVKETFKGTGNNWKSKFSNKSIKIVLVLTYTKFKNQKKTLTDEERALDDIKSIRGTMGYDEIIIYKRKIIKGGYHPEFEDDLTFLSTDIPSPLYNRYLLFDNSGAVLIDFSQELTEMVAKVINGDYKSTTSFNNYFNGGLLSFQTGKKIDNNYFLSKYYNFLYLSPINELEDYNENLYKFSNKHKELGLLNESLEKYGFSIYHIWQNKFNKVSFQSIKTRLVKSFDKLVESQDVLDKTLNYYLLKEIKDNEVLPLKEIEDKYEFRSKPRVLIITPDGDIVEDEYMRLSPLQMLQLKMILEENKN